MSSSSPSPSPFRIAPLPQRFHPASALPYPPSAYIPLDSSSDSNFYSTPRFVTHIDDGAITALGSYYSTSLPRTGRILDFCSSWVSHFPPNLARRAADTASRLGARPSGRQATSSIGIAGAGAGDGPRDDLEVVGLGMNAAELSANPVLSSHHLIDLNVSPIIPAKLGVFDSATCVVSIDYLTRPIDVLSALRDRLAEGASVHLAVSNRCFPTKAIRRWLEVSEEERVRMVGDYLWAAGYEQVEVVCVVEPEQGFRGVGGDPLWVVRGRKPASSS